MRTILHAASESVTSKTHTESSHFACSEASLDHHVAPLVHAGFPFGEVGWDDFGNVVSYFSGALTDSPEESPLGIKLGREL